MIESWTRCLDEYGLDPALRPEAMVRSREDLRERHERFSVLLGFARAEMANLHQQLAGSGFAVLLTDPEGVVLNQVSDPEFAEGAAGAGMMPGAVSSERHQGENASSRERRAADPLEGLQLGDPRMARNVRCAKRVLNSDIPVLLHGETGTGKEVFARAMHDAEGGDPRPFVAVNCASMPASLIESELFGYKPGAFTGASREGYRGKLLRANGGTLFLDEIGDMPLALQARLLRVLDACEVLPLGSETPIKVKFKLISATHRCLPDLVAKGEFREDLYYRLQGLTLSLPPLRERQDKREIIKHLLALEANDIEPVELEEEALELLEGYTWPGNIRQLRNVLRVALALKGGPTIGVRDLPAGLAGNANFLSASTRTDSGGGTAPCLNALDCAERDALIRELDAHHWKVTRLAQTLRLSRNTLYRKMKKLNIATAKATRRRNT